MHKILILEDFMHFLLVYRIINIIFTGVQLNDINIVERIIFCTIDYILSNSIIKVKTDVNFEIIQNKKKQLDICSYHMV